jgi:serine-threonine kinase receptor-associated protein
MTQEKKIPIVCHGHARPIVDVQFSTITPDGYFLASASKDGQPMLRHGESGDWYGTFVGHKVREPSSPDLQPDSSTASPRLPSLLTQSMSRSGCSKMPTCKEVAPGSIQLQGAVWSAVMNPPALLCATGSADFTARVWDACTGTGRALMKKKCYTPATCTDDVPRFLAFQATSCICSSTTTLYVAQLLHKCLIG